MDGPGEGAGAEGRLARSRRLGFPPGPSASLPEGLGSHGPPRLERVALQPWGQRAAALTLGLRSCKAIRAAAAIRSQGQGLITK